MTPAPVSERPRSRVPGRRARTALASCVAALALLPAALFVAGSAHPAGSQWAGSSQWAGAAPTGSQWA